jgi:Rrf2 family protein
MRISAKADYAVRATIELAAAGEDAVVKGVRLADAQHIPLHFLENILGDLKQAGIIATRRGPEGGYKLARPASEVSVADVIRAVEGPLASVRGDSPESLHYDGSAEPLQQVWIALRGKLPRSVAQLARDPDAWARR